MQNIIWQYGASHPENANNFATISQWWSQLVGKEISWQQRLLSQTEEVEQLNWEPQRFDEKFVMKAPEIRGTTLYWHKPDSPQERNITVHKLELNPLRQCLYAFPMSQKEVVLRISLPEVKYQKLALKDPKVTIVPDGNHQVLVMRDESLLVEVKVVLSPESLSQLKQLLVFSQSMIDG
ncbi:MAG: hypothetical protein SFW36_05230 [Leptolyngbyaceae cyanobacterium bins.59]|nr:hypothetical protein [Leptolyngbyaceae cyanobacterium bins.59]